MLPTQRSSFLVSFISYFVLSTCGLFGNGQVYYSTHEINALEKLRPRVSKQPMQDFQKKDAYLLRYLRAYGLNVDEAEKSLLKAQAWRNAHNIDKLYLDNHTLSQNLKFLPHTIEGHDRKGNPLVFQTLGKWLIRKYSISGQGETAVKVGRLLMEKILHTILETRDSTTKNVDQFYLVTDVQGLSKREQLCVGCLPIILQFSADMDAGYAVFVRNVTVINTPRIFLPALGLIKKLWTGSPLLKSFSIYDTDKGTWGPALLKDVSADQLPRVLGGTKT